MPANLTPQYKKAEELFRSAATDQERILALEEMLRAIPKHKGTEHMQADIKRRISKLRDSTAGGRKGSGKSLDLFYIPKSGAGQVALIGTPNSGKSSIVGALTHAKVHIADYPFATTIPVPGMAAFEDIFIEIVDTPPITADYAAPGQVGTYRNTDIIGIVIDISVDPRQQWDIITKYLTSHRLLPERPSISSGPIDSGDNTADTGSSNVFGRKAMVICTKADLARQGTIETLDDICGGGYTLAEISTSTGQGLDQMLSKMFLLLDVVRIYAKKPASQPDMKEPFTLPGGSTVYDLATHIHRELADKLRSARCWGSAVHDGQNVQSDHILHDRDIIELHFA